MILPMLPGTVLLHKSPHHVVVVGKRLTQPRDTENMIVPATLCSPHAPCQQQGFSTRNRDLDLQFVRVPSFESVTVILLIGLAGPFARFFGRSARLRRVSRSFLPLLRRTAEAQTPRNLETGPIST